jgi:hypothetical protein
MKSLLPVLALSLCLSATAKEGKLPPATINISFIENKGQIVDQFGKSRNDIDYKLESNGVTMFVGDVQLHYQWSHNTGNPNLEMLNPKQIINHKSQNIHQATETYRLDVGLLGANKNAEVIAEEKQSYYESYYLPTTSNGTIAHSYKKITYKNVYTNIDWVIYCKDDKVKYDFVVHPGGNPADIRLQYNGATKLEVLEGALIATTPFGSITEAVPYSYWTENKKVVSTQFMLNNNILTYNKFVAFCQF